MSKPLAPYTPGVHAGDWLIVSGQVGARDGALVEGGFEAECRQALSNLASVLAEHGATPGDVVKCTVFLTDMGRYATMNDLYAEFFGDHRPARSAVAVAALPLGAAFEIEAWAILGSPR